MSVNMARDPQKRLVVTRNLLPASKVEGLAERGAGYCSGSQLTSTLS
jgi:hypothetical protein